MTKKVQLVFHVVAATLFVLFFTCNLAAQAQRIGEESIKGDWLVSVHGEDATRTLSILGEVANGSGSLLVAKYSFTGKTQQTIKASVEWSNGVRKLNFITQATTVVSVSEQPDKTFYGTFVLKSGTVKAVLITRLPETGAVGEIAK